MALKMPERLAGDGAVGVERAGEYLFLKVETDGKPQMIQVSLHNAWRLFGTLAVMLGIPLPASIGKLIKLTYHNLEGGVIERLK